MPLSAIAKGRKVILDSIEWGQQVRKKLQDMGMTPGVEFIVVNAPKVGPMLIEVRGTRVAIGRGILSKIYVTPVVE